MSTIQYTIRNIPSVVDKVIRKRSKQTGKSFNQTVVELLTLQTLGSAFPKDQDNFDWLFSKNSLDSSFDEALDSLSRVDNSLWQ